MKKNKTSPIYLLAIFAVCFFAIFSLFNNRGFSFHDETQIANLFEYNKVIDLGHFPPRWSPDTHFTYGSPYLEFNYQIPYYLGVFFHKIGFSFLDSYKLVLASSIVVGALGMYLLGVTISSPLIGLVTATLFTLTPYRAVDVYVRGTIGESLAIGLFPWIVLAFYRLRKNQSYLNIFLAALSVSALILTHQPSTAFGLPIILGIFLLSELINKNYKFILSLFVSLVLSLCLSAFYLIPVILEQKYIQPVLPFNFYDHFPFIKQLLFSKWDYGVSIEGIYDGMSFQMGIANILVVFIGAILMFALIIKKKLIKNIYLFSTLIGIAIILFLMNIRSSFLWNIFPYTNSIQFPWRLLAIMSLLTSLAYLFVLGAVKGKMKTLLLVLIPLIALINNFTYFKPGTIVDHEDNYYFRRYLPQQSLLPGERVSKDYLDYTENYFPLPINATRPADVPSNVITSSQPETRIKIVQSNPFSTKAKITNLTGDFITVNRFFYPGWMIYVNGKEQGFALNQYGAMTLFLEKGTYDLEVYFEDTFIRRFANIVSAMTVIVAGIFLFYNSKRKSGRSK